jgi:hypothetical protein
MVGIFVCLCLASKKPSAREFFVLAEQDLAVHLLARGLQEWDLEDIFSRQLNFQCVVFCVTLLPFVIFC